MLSTFGRALPLVFGEAGMQAKYRNTDGEYLLYDGELQFDSAEAPKKLIVDPGPGSALVDVALYASYLAHRLGTEVDFTFNGTPVNLPSAGIAELTPEEETETLERFKSIEGTGPLTDLDQLSIGEMTKAALASWTEVRQQQQQELK